MSAPDLSGPGYGSEFQLLGLTDGFWVSELSDF